MYICILIFLNKYPFLKDPGPEAVGGDMQQLNQLGAQVGRAAAARGRGGSRGGVEG